MILLAARPITHSQRAGGGRGRAGEETTGDQYRSVIGREEWRLLLAAAAAESVAARAIDWTKKVLGQLDDRIADFEAAYFSEDILEPKRQQKIYKEQQKSPFGYSLVL